MDAQGHENEDEQAATQQIRGSTRAAVDEFRNRHPVDGRPSASSSSDSTATAAARDQDNELDDPPNAVYTKAGMMASMAPGNGGAAKRYLATEQDGRQPDGWEGVSVPDRYGFWHKGIKSERTKVFKVCPTYTVIHTHSGDTRGLG
jgi:hypothetical protein